MTNTAIKKTNLKPAITVDPEVLAIDLGYTQGKAVAAHWSCKFASIVKRRSEVVVSGLADSEGYIITDQVGVWNVGAKGSYDFNAERLVSQSDTPKMLAMLGLYNEETGKSVIDLIVSGLPVEEFMVDEIRDNFTERLKGDFKFGFGDSEKFVQVKRSLTLPQSAGAFFDFVLNEDGTENMDHIELASEDVLVLDLGGKTTDGCIMEAASFSQDSFTIQHGVHKVQNELRKLVLKKHKYAIPPYKVDEVLRTGLVKLGGVSTDVADLCKQAIDQVFPELAQELSVWVPDFRRFSAILICGGGANLYYDYLVELTGIPVIKLDEPEYSNASGYRKYGMLKIKEGLI